MNLLFTICARAGSKGVKNKNVREFCGAPLVYFTLASFALYKEENQGNFEHIDLAINTDSPQLLGQVDKINMDYLFIDRKEILAGDQVSKSEVIKDTMIEAEKIKNYKYDIVVDLDLTSPFRKALDIEGTVSSLLNNEYADIAFSVVESRRSPYFNMVKEKENGLFELVCKGDYVARQQAPVCWDLNASIYAYSRAFLNNNNYEKVTDGNVAVWEMADTLVLDIDSENDFIYMEMLSHFLIEKDSELKRVFKWVSDKTA